VNKFKAKEILGNAVDISFLDGMHLCEFLLRDFINVERACHSGSVIAIHDCFPLEVGMADRKYGSPSVEPSRTGWWTGDVWRTALLIKRTRPDLQILSIDAKPTGLLLISGCDPKNEALSTNYEGFVKEMMEWYLEDIGISEYMREMGLESTDVVNSEQKLKEILARNR
jgi:hypothetical protein